MNQQLTSRTFAGDGDVRTIASFLSSCCTDLHPTYHWHLGDLLWSMYFSTEVDPTLTLRLWEDASEALRGFAWFETPDSVEIQVDAAKRYGFTRNLLLSDESC